MNYLQFPAPSLLRHTDLYTTLQQPANFSSDQHFSLVEETLTHRPPGSVKWALLVKRLCDRGVENNEHAIFVSLVPPSKRGAAPRLYRTWYSVAHITCTVSHITTTVLAETIPSLPDFRSRSAMSTHQPTLCCLTDRLEWFVFFSGVQSPRLCYRSAT